MNQDELREFERRCTQDSPPRCQARCPLHLDVRGFAAAMRDGKHQAARAILERQMPIPGILANICDHPCETVCLRRDLGGSVAVGDLERSCLRLHPEGAKALPRPKKPKKAAVIGAGVAGLSAAWDLAGKGFPVTVHHGGESRRSDLRAATRASLASRGLDFSQVLPEADLDAEYERLAKRGAVFKTAAATAELLAECREAYDAVFVDAGCAEHLCPSPDEVNPVTGSLDEYALCYGGWGDSPVDSAFEGRRGATTLDRVLGGTSPEGARDGEGPRETCLFTPLDGVDAVGRVPAEGGVYDGDGAAGEAARCLQCECMACVRECEYLAHFKSYPKAYARQVFLNVTMVKGHRTANRLINSCALCGQCAEICPDDFSMADLCLRGRREMVANGHMPPSAHEFALNDMAQANGPDCFLARPAPGGDQPAWVLFPGCQLAASRGGQILQTFDHLREHLGGGGIWLGCCGAPARWAGRDDLLAGAVADTRRTWEELGRPEIIAACSSCLAVFRTALPEIPVASLWEALADRAPPPEPARPFSAAVTINDPCAARHDGAWLAAVRALLSRRGIPFDEPAMTADKTSCCGYGGLVWNANPEVADAMASRRADDLTGAALSSCIMCRDRLAAQGKESWHILDALWPEDGMDPQARGPGPSARRFNRANLKKTVLKTLYNGGGETEADGRMNLHMDDALLARLESRHILVEDIEQVIGAAEAGGQRFVDKATGRSLAAKRLGNVTFWVEYGPGPDGGFAIHDAYCHRMIVPGPSTECKESS